MSAVVEEPGVIDPQVLRSALGSFPTGVAIITARGPDGQLVGLTCNSFNSVSLDPPLVSWGLRLSSSNLQAFQQAGAFTVNILAEDQAELSTRFARRDITNKFEGVRWREGLGGAAVLEGCVASFQCEMFAQHRAGDHVLFLGKVARFEHGERSDSIVFYRGAYMTLAKSMRDLAQRCTVNAADLQEARRLMVGMLVAQACERATEADFAAIEANIDALEQATAEGDAPQRVTLALDFFRQVARAAHNDVLMAVAESLDTLLRQVLQAAGPSLRLRSELVPARRRILAHLRARDIEGAQRETAAYFRETSHLERGA